MMFLKPLRKLLDRIEELLVSKSTNRPLGSSNSGFGNSDLL